MKIAGIDPGISGAIAFITDSGKTVVDMPVMSTSNSKKQINAYDLARILSEEKPNIVVIEKVGAMPGQGVTSMFNFGKSVGIVEGVCAALRLPVEFVTPQSWKKKAGLIGKDKDFSRTLAIQKNPDIVDRLSRKKDIGRADAINIAMHYCAQKVSTGVEVLA